MTTLEYSISKLENPTKRAAASTLLKGTLALAPALIGLFGNCLHVYHIALSKTVYSPTCLVVSLLLLTY